MTLWEIDIHPADGQPDLLGSQVVSEAHELGFSQDFHVDAAYGYLIQGELSEEVVKQAAEQLLADAITERTVVARVGAAPLMEARQASLDQPQTVVHVMRKPGVMDPTAESTHRALRDLRIPAEAVRTLRKFWIRGLSSSDIDRLCQRILANQSIEQTIVGPMTLRALQIGSKYDFEKRVIPILQLDDPALERLSRAGQLYLSLAEMKTVQAHFSKSVASQRYRIRDHRPKPGLNTAAIRRWAVASSIGMNPVSGNSRAC